MESDDIITTPNIFLYLQNCWNQTTVDPVMEQVKTSVFSLEAGVIMGKIIHTVWFVSSYHFILHINLSLTQCGPQKWGYGGGTLRKPTRANP